MLRTKGKVYSIGGKKLLNIRMRVISIAFPVINYNNSLLIYTTNLVIVIESRQRRYGVIQMQYKKREW